MDYCNWCESNNAKALPMPLYSRAFKLLGVRKGVLWDRVHYFDVQLRSVIEAETLYKEHRRITQALRKQKPHLTEEEREKLIRETLAANPTFSRPSSSP